MNKAQQARIRDELLQSLYAATLRATLAAATEGKSAEDAAFAAGIAACLRPSDLLLLPRRGCAALRTLRRHALQLEGSAGTLYPLEAGILTTPAEEASAIAQALGAAAAAQRAGGESLVLVFLETTLDIAGTPHRQAMPATWDQAAAFATRFRLPLLLASSSGPARVLDPRPAHVRPATPYPSIPVDNRDALAVYRVMHECAQRARAGLGASHIAGTPFHVRGTAEPVDGLLRLEEMQRRRGTFSKSAKRELIRALTAELTE